MLIAATFLLAQLFGGAPMDGIRCDSMEGAVEHIHSHIFMADHGRPVGVPAQIGIPEGGSCLYWVHTHTDDGFIHIESPVKKPFTLGNFFDIWGQTLSRTEAASLHAGHGGRLAVWVNGRPYTGDPNAIVLRDHESIVIQNGPPYATAPKVDWSKL